jgi:hypothetical protein
MLLFLRIGNLNNSVAVIGEVFIASGVAVHKNGERPQNPKSRQKRSEPRSCRD